MKSLGIAVLVNTCIYLFQSGCAYRFSNASLSLPFSSQKLAIEGVYDTGEDVLPHQLLWFELQKSFAARGKMRLTSIDDADLVLRTMIVKSHQASGNIERDKPDRDLVKGKEILTKGNPRDNLINLSRAGSWTKNQGIAVVVNIEIWSMHTGKRVFSRKYDIGSGHKSMFGAEVAGIMSNYLLNEEGQYTAVRKLSKLLADKVVADFFM